MEVSDTVREAAYAFVLFGSGLWLGFSFAQYIR